MYSYLTDDGCVDEKAKSIKKCAVEPELQSEDLKNSLESNKIILKTHQRFNSEEHNILTEKFNNIYSRINDDNRLQTLDGVTIYPYGYGC